MRKATVVLAGAVGVAVAAGMLWLAWLVEEDWRQSAAPPFVTARSAAWDEALQGLTGEAS
jgi:hypothetical protein